MYKGLQCPLLSRQSLKKLGILPADLPRSALSLLRPAPGQMPNSEERSEVELIRVNILKEYADLLRDDTVPTMKGPPMVIKLNDGATPCRVNGARAIPFAHRDQVKEHIDQMVKERVIEPVSDTCDCCHPIVLADKKNTAEKRITIDLT